MDVDGLVQQLRDELVGDTVDDREASQRLADLNEVVGTEEMPFPFDFAKAAAAYDAAAELGRIRRHLGLEGEDGLVIDLMAGRMQ